MKNKKHLSFIHEHACCLSFVGGCDGPLHAHHLLRPWSGKRGMGMKAGDENTIPLCMGHHGALHMRGDEDGFFAETCGDSEYGRNTAKQFWQQSQDDSGAI